MAKGPANIRLEPSVTDEDAGPGRARRKLRESRQGFHRLPAPRRKRFPLHRARSQGRGQEPARRQRSRRASTPGRRTAASSSSPTATCTTSGISNAATHTSSRRSPRRLRHRLPEDHARPPAPHREQVVGDDYIVLTQRPNYRHGGRMEERSASGPATSRPTGCASFAPYQLKAIHGHPGRPSKKGKDRFLFEMATGTGKTLTAAAVIKLFLRTGNARRVLFLVDRLELEDQAQEGVHSAARRPTSDSHLQGEPRRLAPCGDRRHHRPVAALQQQVPAALLADRLRPRHLRRSAPLHRRQCPRRLRLLHRLQARPHRHAARLPQAVRPGQAHDHATRARPSAACCSTPTAPSAARTASRLSATRCSMA